VISLARSASPISVVLRHGIAPARLQRQATSSAASEHIERGACACGGGCPRCAGAGLQPKLAVSEPGDALEQEADRVAEAAPVPTAAAQPGLRGAAAPQLQRQAGPSPAPAPASPPVSAPAAPAIASSFEELPRELQAVLETSVAERSGARRLGCEGVSAAVCFEKLGTGVRATVRSIYNRFQERGLWEHVLRFDGIWTGGIDCRYFQVQRGVAGADIVVKDGKEFFKSLLADPRFCVDTAAGGVLHPGTSSVREVSSSDSLHLAIGRTSSVSVHVDTISPVGSRGTGGFCSYDPTRAAAHIGREAIPSLIPGLQVFPEQLPPRGELGREAPPPTLIQWGIRF
jgi:hypothetical protein